jgi:hypothetical protein
MPSGGSDYAPLWAAISKEYRSLQPELPELRSPGTNYLQVNAGGKAAHYEWKLLYAPRSHVEVALHFEAPSEEKNQAALEIVQAKNATIRGGTLMPFIAGRWGGKWTRVGFQVAFTGKPGQDVAQQSAQLMKLLIERTYPLVRSLVQSSAKAGWPAA